MGPISTGKGVYHMSCPRATCETTKTLMTDSSGNNAENKFETFGLHVHTIAHRYHDYKRHTYRSVGREEGAKRGSQSWLEGTSFKSVKGLQNMHCRERLSIRRKTSTPHPHLIQTHIMHCRELSPCNHVTLQAYKHTCVWFRLKACHGTRSEYSWGHNSSCPCSIPHE